MVERDVTTTTAGGSGNSRTLLDPTTGREVIVVYAMPAELCAQPESSVADVGIDPWQLLLRIWHGRWLVAGCTLLAALIGVAVALSKPNQYTASVTALPPAEKGGGLGAKLGQYADLAAMAGVAMPGGGGGSVDEILAILDSRDLAMRLAREFALADYYQSETDDDLIRDVRKDFSARHDKKANRVTITCTHQQPATAAAIANRAVEELQDRFNGIKQGSSKRERAFLESRLQIADKELSVAQERLAAFQRQHHTIEIQSQTKATVEALSKLQGELIAQQVELRARLATQASPDNPAVQLLQQRVEEMTKAITNLAGSGPVDGEGKDPGVLLGLGALPELGIQYVGLFREVKKGEAMVTTLTAQVEAARIAEVRDAEVITIIDRAVPPQRKSGPPRAQVCIAAILLGALVGMALVLLAPVLAQLRQNQPVS
jgi:uncharacterized protein involved in exopolysaccharide biosynthesis